jgi:tetratricopeptide (TPR) repeat protein
MRCQAAQQFYEEYAQGNLSPEVAARLEEHLARCPECRRRFDASEQLGGLLREASQVAHPGGDYFEGLAGRVLGALDQPDADVAAALDAEQNPQPGWPGLRGPLWWSGAVAAAALLVLALADGLQRVAPGSSPTAANVAMAMPVVGPGSTARLDPLVALASAAPSRAGPNGSVATLDASTPDAVAAGHPDSPVSTTPASSDAGTNRVAPMVAASVAPAQEVAAQLASIRQQVADAQGDATGPTASGSNDAPADAAPVNDVSERQARMFAQALDALRQDQPRQAWSQFSKLIAIAPTTTLARRADLKLGDLNYDAWADFAEAQKYFNLSLDESSGSGLSADERKHVGQRLDRLRVHAANHWEALALQHVVQQGEWPEALTALSRLIALDDVTDLMPDVARTVADRVQSAPGAPIDVAKSAYKLLETRAEIEQKKGSRAWLELALGDMQIAPFQDPQAALFHYSLAVETAPKSTAGRLAAAKRDQLLDRQLLELAR